jgi:4-amino-4-deoxy-L-arabinose transferase-like glycosyltransferase
MGHHRIFARLFAWLVWIAAVMVGILTFLFLPWRRSDSFIFIIGFGVAMLALSIAMFRLMPHLRVSHRGTVRTNTWLFFVIVAGTILRIVWIWAVPPVQLSDYQAYWELALRLVESGTYSEQVAGHELRAFRPPGYPFFLAAWMTVFGAQEWLPALTNILLFVATAITVYGIALRISGNTGIGVIAAMLLAVWPSYIAMTGLAASEPLSLLLLSATTWTLLKADNGRLSWAIATGLLSGFAMLVKSSFMLLPTVWYFYAIVGGDGSRRHIVRHAVLATFVAILVLVPWMTRNYAMFHAMVPISTNGGDVFYRANNPNASGGYTETGARSLSQYLHDEIEWNKTGYAWGMAWIRANPGEFAKLMIKKEAIFLGDDSTGFYWTLNRGHAMSGAVNRISEIAANMFWIVIWLLVVYELIRNRTHLRERADATCILASLLYLVAIHSVFESQPRYHMPMYGLLAVIAACAFASPRCQKWTPISGQLRWTPARKLAQLSERNPEQDPS